ncbi:hypothetical protein [Streptomyces sp. VB1]|uniref:hypothetical protein n=1 Tax=Streptomyces sp. VB1 TaxID=2986803 RepID=UPI002241D2EF|nr:hypothetical protein [Streptomyces sp. VB1]UZI33950.1 hypothetical protein OH133_38760 [Streptomyces sp. VB1]
MPSTQEIIERMHRLQTKRHAAFAPLASVLSQREEIEKEIADLRDQLEKRLAELEAPYKTAYNGAVTGGWSVEELATLGAPEPPKRGRPKRGRNAAAKKNTEPNSPAASPADTSTEIPGKLDAEGVEPKVEQPVSA